MQAIRRRQRSSRETMLQILATFVTVAVNLFQRETVGTWNVMTMYAAGKLSQLTNEMTNNGLSNTGNQRGTTNWFQTSETFHRIVAPVLWSRKGKEAFVQISTERANWLGSTLPPDTGFLQDNRKQDSHEHSVLSLQNHSDEQIKQDFFNQLQSVIQRYGRRDISSSQ